MLFDAIEKYGEKKTIVYFSTGRDSCVMLDLFAKHYAGEITAIFLYYYKDLPTRNRFLAQKEKQYGITIIQRPILDLLRRKRKGITWRDLDDGLRDEFKTEWIARGYRKDESVSRRGQLKYCQDGKDLKTKVFYPLIDWRKAHIELYCKREKITLPEEYKYGFRDITIYKGAALIWLYNNYKEDYNKIREQYPAIEGELLRAKEKARSI